MRLILSVIMLLAVADYSWSEEKSNSVNDYINLVQVNLGNIFNEAQHKQIIIETSFSKVSWTIEDFYGKSILTGQTEISKGRASLELPLKLRGYFILKVSAGNINSSVSLAVVSPFDVKQVSDSPFGICTHFAQGWPLDALHLIAMAGIKTVRDEMYWSRHEQKPGIYDFSKIPPYVQQAYRMGIRTFISLSYANPLYDDNNAPCSDAGRHAFANYGKAVVEKYGKALEGVEVWNEYNCGFGTGKTGNSPKSYNLMQKEVYEVIKAASPETRIVGVAMSGLSWEWLEQLFQFGALKYMDAVSVHPYRWEQWDVLGPESLDADMDRLAGVIKKYNDSKLPKPIWCTEISWPAIPKWDVSPEKQADYIVRTYAVLIGKGIPKVYWYDFVCDDREGQEGNFGIVANWKNKQNAFTPRPAYAALAVMIRQFTGWTFIKREPVSTAVLCMKFKKNKDIVRMLWSTEPSPVTMKTSDKITMTDIMGNEETLEPLNGEIYLGLSGSPIYIKGKIDSIVTGVKLSVSTKAQIACGEPVIFNMSTNIPFNGILDIDGASRAVNPTDTKIFVQFPAINQPRERVYKYRFKVADKTVAAGYLPVKVKSPLQLKSAVVTKKDSMEFTFNNNAAKDDITLDSVQWNIMGQKNTVKPEFVIKAGTTQRFSLTIPELTPFKIVSASIILTFNNGQTLEYSRQISYSECNFVKDGSCVRNTLPIALEKLGRIAIKGYKGNDDLHGKLWLGWNNENFYMTAEITDDKFNQRYPMSAMWDGDGIQFGIARNADNRYEFGAVMTLKGAHAECVQAPIAVNCDTVVANSYFATQFKGKSVIYTCVIPWEMLKPISPKDGSLLFSFLVNDNDGEGRKGWIEWAGGIGSGKEIINYQTIILKRP